MMRLKIIFQRVKQLLRVLMIKSTKRQNEVMMDMLNCLKKDNFRKL